MQHVSRRSFLETSAAVTALALCSRTARAAAGDKMAYGLVTYLWGQDWDLPTLIANCEKSGALGVELRTTHAHGVEPALDDKQRAAVRERFADSEVTLVGIGSNERYDDPDPAVVKKAIDATKEFIQLSHDVGSTGVKVKPDRFHPDVPREKTIEQIGKSLNELGKYADGFGQQIRLEVHGQCAELPTIKAIMDIADHQNVAVCWNSNPQDLQGGGLEHNFGLVRDRFGATCHVRELDSPDYPYQQLIDLLVKTDYEGWILLESSSKPADKVAALAGQVVLFQELVKKSQG
ncbi:MAG: TIM barrel protein [Planctomycetota bacterium]|nr:TIM barrel protein [Planctomycetota bacterium]